MSLRIVVCGLTLLGLFWGCGGYEIQENASVLIIASATVVDEGATVVFDASQSEFNELEWRFNGNAHAACKNSSYCEITMNTVGTFEISATAIVESTKKSASVNVQVNSTTRTVSHAPPTSSNSSSTQAEPAFIATTGKLSQTEVWFHNQNPYSSLNDPFPVQVSPDNLNVYVLSESLDAITVFSRNTETGALSLVEVIKDGVDDVVGMGSPRFMYVSPDGRNVYVTTYSSELVVFSRSSISGTLTFLEKLTTGVDGVQGLGSNYDVVVSHDGKNLYTVNGNGDSISTFDRDVTTGELSYVETLVDGSGGVAGLNFVISVDISPDDQHLYTTSFYGHSLAIFSRDESDGTLKYEDRLYNGLYGTDGLHEARRVRVSSDGNHVYTVSAHQDMISAFSRDATDGSLTFVETEADSLGGVLGLNGAYFLDLSEDGTSVYVASYVDDAIMVFDRNTDTGELSVRQQVFNNNSGFSSLDYVQGISVAPDGKSVYAVSKNNDAVVVMSRDTTTGELTYLEEHTHGVGIPTYMEVPYRVISSADGKHVYVANYSSSSILTFERNASTGILQYKSVVKDGVNGVDGIGGIRALTLSPDNQYVYAGSVLDDAIAVFSRDPQTGKLSYLHHLRDGVGGVDGLGNAVDVVVSPDGKNVYVASQHDYSVTLFNRDTSTGVLSYVKLYKDGANGIDGLLYNEFIAISPDGKYLYAAGNSEDKVAIFSRDESDGTLTYVDVIIDGVNDVDGLNDVNAIVLNASGTHVYISGGDDHAIAFFTRDVTTGLLTYVEVYKNNVDDVTGISGIRNIALAPDEKHLYAGAGAGKSVTVFSRDTGTGSLSFVETHIHAQNDITGLNYVNSLIVSPDNKHVYATGYSDNSLTLFTRE